MEENNTKNTEGVTVDLVDVHMFDFGLVELIDKVMFSNLIRGFGALIMLGLAMLFGGMFLFGGVNLIIDKKGGNDSTEAIVIEHESEETTAEVSDEETTEEGDEE